MPYGTSVVLSLPDQYRRYAVVIISSDLGDQCLKFSILIVLFTILVTITLTLIYC